MSRKFFLPISIALASRILLANPENPKVQAGSVEFSCPNDQLMEIRSSDGAVIHWKDFSIERNEIARFIQPHSSSRVLNRVTGKTSSSLLGTLEANGQVFLLNPNGVLIGKDAKIKTGGFFVTTYELNDRDFLEGRYLELEDGGEGGVVNHGQIEALDGEIYLIARTVENTGSLSAQNVTLGAGGEWVIHSLDPNRPGVKLSEIPSDLTHPYSAAIRHSGTIRAVGLEENKGTIRLVSEDEILLLDSATVTALDGGFIHGWGQNIYVGPDVALSANSEGIRDGGRVVLFAEDAMDFQGRIEARGGAQRGDGGFVEVSGKHLGFHGTVSTLSPTGKAGELLLDPLDLSISASPNLTVSGGPIFTPLGPLCNSNLNTGTLTTALLSSNVTVKTTGTTGACPGDITVVDPFSWGSGFSLTLDAAHDVIVRAKMEATAGGAITLLAANQISIDPAATAGPAEVRTNRGNITATASVADIRVLGGTVGGAHAGIFSDSGTITLTPAVNLTVFGGMGVGSYAEISSRAGPINGSIGSGGTLTVQGNGPDAYGQIGYGTTAGTVAVSSNITFTFDPFSMDVNVLGGMSGAYAQIGHAPHPAAANTTVAGSIKFNPPNLGVGNNINVTGGALNATAIIGHGNEFTATTKTASGDFQIFAQGAITVQGGTAGNQSHAVVGFHTPEGGPSALYSATSNLLDVRTLISGDINIKGGTGSNGIVGYYNNTTAGSFVTVDFKSIHVQPTDSNLLLLTAGNINGTAHGSAVLGTLDLGGSALSNIAIRSGGVQVLGPQLAGDDGSARLINGRPNVAAARTLSIDCFSTPLVADIAVLGGSGISPGFAEIYSVGTLDMQLLGHLYVNRSLTFAPILQNGPASIVSNGAMTINGNASCSDLVVMGGTNTAFNYRGSALLQSIHSTITFGSIFIPGGTNIIVGSTLSQAPSQILTSTGQSLFAFGSTATLQGGEQNMNAPHASAEIRSDLGDLVFQGGSSLSLTGGTGLLCFAEISSTLGDVFIHDLTGSIVLSGGTTAMGVDAYAQIGRGIGIPTTTIKSTISFENIGGSMTLTANDGPGAYVQIGQAPIDPILMSTVTGDVTFISGVTSVTLQGGSVATNTAIIGHGNELTPTLTSVTGSIDVIVNSAGGASLLASNTVGQAHAIIGFCNPKAGSTVPFTVNSQSVSLTNQGITQLTAGLVGSNAVIGYYNGSPQANTVTLAVQNITVDNGGNQTVFLQAGNDPATGSTGEAPIGIAAIGTSVNTIGSTAFSNISVNASTLTLNGPTAMNNGSARILNSHPNAANPLYNITIQPTTNINVLGGVGFPNGFADIYSCNNLTIQYTGNFYINEAFPIFQNGYAHVVGNEQVEVNTFSFGIDLRLTGGNSNMVSGGSADALLQSLNGHLFVGNGFSPGTQNIYIGRTGSESPSKIEAFQGTNAVGASQDIILQGGKVNLGPPEATAQIRNLNGEIDVYAGRDLIINGGTGPLTYAQITTFHNNININQVGRDLLLTGGTGTQSYAQIGVGLDLTEANITSNINFSFIGRNVILQGATVGDSGYAQIGHAPFGAALFYTANGDITFPSSGANGFVRLNGGAVNNTTAIIGHGNPLSPFLNFAQGMISVGSGDLAGVTLNAGTGAESHTVIGFFNPIAGSMPSFTAQSNAISVTTTQGPITLNANAGMNATIGYYHTAALATPINVQISAINVVTGTAPPPGVSNFVVLNADHLFPNGIASIGTFGPTGSTTTSSIAITTYELDLNGPPAGKNGAARVLNNQPPLCDLNDVTIRTTNINEIGGLGTGFADIYSSHNLTIFFNGILNVNLNPVSPLTLQNGNATITSCNTLSVKSNANKLGTINVLGGSNIGVLSQISSTHGDVLIGDPTQDIKGVNQINVGRADMKGPARITSATGKVGLVTAGTVNVIGGNAPGGFADLTAFKSMTGTIGGDLNVLGGTGGGTDAIVSAADGTLSLTVMGSINVLAQAGSNASIVKLGLTNDFLHLEAVNDINIGLNSFIQNQGSGETAINAERNAFLTNNAFVQNNGNGPLTFFTGVSMFLLNTSQILTNGGIVSLVVDNLFPTPASGIGNGAFQMDSGAVIFSNGAATRIFTARRPLNRIDGLIEGTLFVPGTEFVDTNEEIWGVYFFSPLGGTPFTVFYKEAFPIPVTPVINKFVRNINNEYFEVIKSYDDFLFVDIPIPVAYDHAFSNVMSAEIMETRIYHSLRRLYRDYRLKIIDPLQ